MRRRAVLALALAGCGFRSARVVGSTLAVEAAPVGTVEVALREGAVAGARGWLGAQGVGVGEGYPRLWIEVFEVEERGVGLAVAGGEPRARGVRLEARGRAILERAPGQIVADSGVISVEEGVEPGGVGGGREGALRGLGWRLGETLVRRVWGEGEPLVERM
jgi:hypothetical protein